MVFYQDIVFKEQGRNLGTFYHGRRTFGYVAGRTKLDQTHWYSEAKRAIYSYVSGLPKGGQVIVYKIKEETGLSEQMIDNIIFVDNFKDGNPCNISVIRTKGGWRKVYRL